ncbi:enoyl-CoA hydratase/isomerase family protein [Chloroflexota bacterium]
MSYETLALAKDGKIGIVSFTRPKVLNAFDTLMCQEISTVCHEIACDADIRAVIFTGSGRAFVAGADIAHVYPLDSMQGLEFLKWVHRATKGIEDLEIPTIAAVNGFCFGGGNELAISCDIRIASENAKFGQQEINWGLAPGGGATQRLTRLVGYGRAMEIILTGDAIDVHEAYRIGLVNKIVPADSLMDECLKFAQALSLKSRASLSQAKASVKASRSLDLEHGLEFEFRGTSLLWSTKEQKELMGAFVEKQQGG